MTIYPRMDNRTQKRPQERRLGDIRLANVKCSIDVGGQLMEVV